MKLQKIVLRGWLAGTSLLLFVGGWIALAHSPKPVAVKTSRDLAAPVFQPIPSLEELSDGQGFSQPRMVQVPMTRLRTRGS